MTDKEAIFLNDKLSIHDRYQMLIGFFTKKRPVLKTDLWNEINTDFPIRADGYVEIDANLVARALKKDLPAVQGSITNLPFKNESFSTVIDLSTIDHIADPLPALIEYCRVLKKDNESSCFLVTWLGNRPSEQMKNWDGRQYYFPEQKFVRDIYRAGFTILRSEKFEGIGDGSAYLKFFHLKKRTGFLDGLFKVLFNNTYLQCLTKSATKNKSIIHTSADRRIYPDEMLKTPGHNFEFTGTDENGDISLTAANGDPQIILPEIILPEGYVAVFIDITPPVETILELFYLTNNNDTYGQEKSIAKIIGPGRSFARILIPEKGIHGRIRLDPGNKPGTYVIHNLSIF